MDENAKRPKKLKDLDPKDRAKEVKGGILCLVGTLAGAPYRAAERIKGTTPRAPDPR